MKVFGREIIEQLGKKHADARSASSEWLQEVCEAQWEKRADISERFASASFLPDKVVIFNIKGNRYRIAVKVAYNTKSVYILQAGTHQEYDRWTF